jgi:hypothetical protein
MKHYRSPWSTSLVVISAGATIVCLGVSLSVVTVTVGRGVLPWVGLLPLAILVGSAPFTIRGYTVTAEAILVHRLCWATRLPREGLQSATAEPGAMRGSLRTCGNGGLFSFSGRYWSKRLGPYRALVTDPRRTVVLRYVDHTVVVSPASPEQFAGDLAEK